jgi:dTDP-glucose 4,6-dehydratase
MKPQERVIVTGGAGFIGSALCRHLVNTGAEILNIDKLTYAANLRSLDPVANRPNYHFLAADICDLETIEAAFRDFRPNAVMHLAAESHVDRSITGSAPFIATNIMGTYTLLEAALSYWRSLDSTRSAGFRFLQVSTDEVYGSLGEDGLFSEETRYDPSSPYSSSKAAADLLALAWNRTYGLPTIVSNCTNNYGPYHFPEKLIPLAITNAIDGLPISVYGDGGNIRDWLHVEDHVRALDLIVSRGRPGHKYNIGSRCERTNLDLVRTLCTVLDRLVPDGRPHERLIRFVTDRPGHDQRYAIDPAKVERELGWRPRETLETGLRKTVAWYLDNRDWWQPLKDVYKGQRLGLVVVPAADHSALATSSVVSL